jgi:hypothetical protein
VLEDDLEVALGDLGARLNEAAAAAGVVLEQAGVEVAEEAAEANLDFQQRLDNLNSYTVEQRAEFESDVAELLQDYDAEIDTLEAQVAQADEATRTELNEEIAQLRQHRDQLQQQADQLQAATAEEWQELKMELLTGIENLDRSFEEAESRVS